MSSGMREGTVQGGGVLVGGVPRVNVAGDGAAGREVPGGDVAGGDVASGRDRSEAPWLLVVDPQNIFAHPDSEWASPFFDAALANIQRLAQHFGDRVLITRWLPTAERHSAWGDYFAAWPFADVPADHNLYQLVDGARNLSPHPTVDEPTFGKWSPQLRQIVGEAPRLVVTGVSTDCCVITTVLAAADAGAWVQVPTDAVAHSTASNGEAALKVMSFFPPQVELTTTAALLGA